MSNKQIIKQLEEIKEAIRDTGFFNAFCDTLEAIETLKDPENALKKAREETERWKKKYNEEHEILERFRSNRPA